MALLAVPAVGLAACSEAEMRRLEDAVAETRASSPRFFGEEAPARGRGGLSAPSARPLDGRELASLLDGSSVMVEWYERGEVVELECGYFARDGWYEGINYVADDRTYDLSSFVDLEGSWSTRGDRLCVNAQGWSCFAAEWAYGKLQLIHRGSIVANALVFDGAWEFEHNNCGLA